MGHLLQLLTARIDDPNRGSVPAAMLAPAVAVADPDVAAVDEGQMVLGDRRLAQQPRVRLGGDRAGARARPQPQSQKNRVSLQWHSYLVFSAAPVMGTRH